MHSDVQLCFNLYMTDNLQYKMLLYLSVFVSSLYIPQAMTAFYCIVVFSIHL